MTRYSFSDCHRYIHRPLLGFLIGVTLLTSSAYAQHGGAPAVSPKEALSHLTEGNARYVSGKAKHPRQDAARRKGLTAGQHPFATVLSCSDSRVPPEVVFDEGIGDLFVVRVAGNIGGEDDLGSVEYAVEHLGTSLVVVMGHEKCGAVTAALAPDSVQALEANGIRQMLAHVAPSLVNVDRSLDPAEQVHLGVEANVRASVTHLRNTPEFREKIESGKLNVVGAIYELETGKVNFIK